MRCDKKHVDILRNVLASVSDDKRIRFLLYLMSVLADFLRRPPDTSTAVAIPMGILIALGFNLLKAAIASLAAANTVPAAFWGSRYTCLRAC